MSGVASLFLQKKDAMIIFFQNIFVILGPI